MDKYALYHQIYVLYPEVTDPGVIQSFPGENITKGGGGRLLEWLVCFVVIRHVKRYFTYIVVQGFRSA